MLTPGYLAGLPAPMVELYSQLEEDIVCDMARRISKAGTVTETANYQAWRLEQLAGFQKSTQKKLARMTGKTERQLRVMFRRAARDAVAADNVIFEAAGLTPTPISKNAVLNQIVLACEKQTLGVFENLTRTTANTATRQFERALDRAALQISSGAFDYKSAIRRAVKDLSEAGIETIVYSKGGRVTQRAHLDVAVRRAVLTGVNQMAAQVSLANAQQLGCDLVETTAHQGARPEHTVWQGKIFSISGRHPKYPQLSKATGYGTGDGLCGWNCRHSFYPYFEGISVPAYTKETLDEMAAATVFYNGEELTQYDASQKQRYIERKIRKWKREYLAMEAAGQDTGEAAVKLKEWRTVQADFCRQTGLRADNFRGQVHGFGRSQAGKATWAVRNNSVFDIVINGNTYRYYPITNDSIRSVPLPFFHKLSGKMNIAAKGYAQELLRRMMDKPVGAEGTVSFSLDGKAVRWHIGDGNFPTVKIQKLPVPYISFHNHPDNMSFSPEDYMVLLRNEKLVGIGVVGNPGTLFTCQKDYGYNEAEAIKFWNRLSKKYPDYRTDMVQRLAFSEEFMKGADSYGLTIDG